MYKTLILCSFNLWVVSSSTLDFITPCRLNDTKLGDCIIEQLYGLQPHLVKGLSEINLPSVEPFQMDSLSLSLTHGPNGYKITLREIDMFGLSNFTITKLKLREAAGKPFEGKVYLPRMAMNSLYVSSGVLLVIPATGNGTFHADLADTMVTVKGLFSEKNKDGRRFYHLDKIDLTELNIKNAKMSVAKAYNNNRILLEATNLFLKENGQEVLKVMMPQLKVKIANQIKKVVNHVLQNVPATELLV